MLIDRAVEIRLASGSPGGVATATTMTTSLVTKPNAPPTSTLPLGINPSEFVWNYPKPSLQNPNITFKAPSPLFDANGVFSPWKNWDA